MKKSKGFTLIELLAVIVILAILALIAIPIIINIINDSRENSYKRSIQAYGRSVENAIATWQSKNDGDLPRYISDYTVKTSGAKVECDNEIIGIDGENGIELTNCKVVNSKGKAKSKEYSYKKGQVERNENNYKEYHIGDKIELNGEYYYVIKESSSSENYVTALKEYPLTVDEVNRYGDEHVNKYADSPIGEAYNYNGYGGITYYSSPNCGNYQYGASFDGCRTDYNSSDIKYVVDNWADSKFQNAELTSDNKGYKARLIMLSELENIGYVKSNSKEYWVNDKIPNWVWDVKVYCWTMSSFDSFSVWAVSGYNGLVSDYMILANNYAVRPVINVYKSAID